MPQSRIYVILALIVMTHSVFADINFEIFADDRDYPNKCVIDTPKGQTIVGSGETIHHPTKCGLIECGRYGWALVYTCNLETPPQGCAYVDYVDINTKFPSCCKMSLKCNFIDRDP